MMRPIPAISTDLLYSGHFNREDLIELGDALGTTDIKNITTATQEPERVLYHACLNGIQTYVRLDSADEKIRAEEIADLADAMYAKLLPAYQKRLQDSTDTLARKQQEARFFCGKIETIEGAKHWNATRFASSWNVNDYPPRWQKKAIESYGIIRSRIENGEYKAKAGQNAGTLTDYWCQRNLEYKHYRDHARNLVETYVHTQLPKESLLTMHPADQRIMTMFIGGMGSGKSEMTRSYVASLPETSKHDIVLHNADYLKHALCRSAMQDGKLPPGHVHKGPETQAESSNALYEGTRKRAYLARQKFHAPNTVINSIVLGSFEVLEGVAGGGKVMAHHIFMPQEEAVKEADARAQKGGRVIAPEDIVWSASASAKSLLLLTNPSYKEMDVSVRLYSRHAGCAPEPYGLIDAAHGRLYVQDLKKLAELSAYVFPNKNDKESLRQFLQQFRQAGFVITLSRAEHMDEALATLDTQGKLSIHELAEFARLDEYKDVVRGLAADTQLGNSITLKPTQFARAS